jgi:ribosome-binding factor A
MLRGPVGRALGIRHSPELRFVRDELIQNGARMSALISNAVKEDAVRHVDDVGSSPDETNAGEDDHTASDRPSDSSR